MSERIYIDCNCEVGKRANIINDNIPYTLDALRQSQKKYGVDRSLAISSKCFPYSIVAGNEEIIEISKKYESIIPISTIYPGFEYDIKSADQYLQYLYENGVKGIRLDLTKLFIFNKRMFDKVFSFCQKVEMPIIVDWDTIENKNSFFELLLEYSNLKIVITNVNWSFRRYLFSYMKENKNINIGMNGFVYQNMVEDFCQRFGSERLLFATGYPLYDVGSVKAMVEYADISEMEKNNIAYKNAIRIFKLSPYIKKRKYGEDYDEIMKMVDSGENLRKLPFNIIDSHTHFMSEEAGSIDWMGSESDLRSLITSSKKIGISEICTSPLDGLLYDGLVSEKSMVKALNIEEIHINGLVTANPYYSEDINNALSKLKEEKYVGLKLYPSKNQYPYDGKLYEPLFEETINQGKYFLLHGTTDDARKILEKYAGLNVILAHSTQNYKYMDSAIELLKAYPNLSVDICNRYMINGAIEYLVSHGCEDQVVFGSDSSLLSQSAHIGWLSYSDIGQDNKEKILSKNISRIIRR